MKAASVVFSLVLLGAAAHADELASVLKNLDGRVLEPGDSLRSMLEEDLSARIKQANERSSAAWRAVQTQADWEAYRQSCLHALRDSLGTFPSKLELNLRTTAEHRGAGYVVRNVVYTSRPGLIVTANLYVPDPPREKSPGILISHAHHTPKTHGELQDMGILWSRAGCFVLVPDHLGHGERRQHPFGSASDYPEKFQVSRQDYYFRYNVALQLYVAGESLMGWMANDLMRGVDVLLAQKSIDRDRIILLGAVAGGGDPAAVTAALDPRIAAVVPFNFGGPQPESKYPLPEDAETRFNYAGGGSWESTRNLYRSAKDGFLPWVIVGSVAPRRVVHAHEFAWDQQRDPVWKRYQRIFSLYGEPENLAFAHGFGRLSGQPPEASHCTHIGRPHRQLIHAAFEKWFDIRVDEARAVERHPPEDLLCLSSTGEMPTKPLPAREIALQLARGKSRALQATVTKQSPAEKRAALQAAWAKQLGNIAPYEIDEVETRSDEMLQGLRVARRLLHGPGNLRLPLILLTLEGKNPQSVVILIAQQGKAEILRQRAKIIARLLQDHAVCLVDLRGTGESRAGSDRGRRSEATALAATALMLGDTLVGQRLSDLRSVIGYLRTQPDYREARILLSGDSLVETNAADDRLGRPLELEQPKLAEPLGATLALLAALFDDRVQVLAARGGLESYASLCESPFAHIPFDCVVPGAAAIGDLPLLVDTLAAQISPHAIQVQVTGLNVPIEAMQAK
jgi:dienelactone hydrolase